MVVFSREWRYSVEDGGVQLRVVVCCCVYVDIYGVLCGAVLWYVVVCCTVLHSCQLNQQSSRHIKDLFGPGTGAAT